LDSNPLRRAKFLRSSKATEKSMGRAGAPQACATTGAPSDTRGAFRALPRLRQKNRRMAGDKFISDSHVWSGSSLCAVAHTSYLEWDTEADIENYRGSEEHKEIVRHARALKGSKVEVKLYDLVT
jgi:hypothetical protein